LKEWDRDRYYEILELKPGASAEEIKRAYKDLVKVWHPDRFSHDPQLQQKAQEKLKEINEAYEQLRFSRTGFRSRGPRSYYNSSPSHERPGKPIQVWRFPSLLSVLATLVIFFSFRFIPVRLIGIFLIILFFFLFLRKRLAKDKKKR
tara:strand:- start:516 stop:956 length:441 start_codon:yes stop_codon:yes gene_type:complete